MASSGHTQAEGKVLGGTQRREEIESTAAHESPACALGCSKGAHIAITPNSAWSESGTFSTRASTPEPHAAEMMLGPDGVPVVPVIEIADRRLESTEVGHDFTTTLDGIDPSQHDIARLSYFNKSLCVCINTKQDTATGIDGGGVAGTRISPECRYLMESQALENEVFAPGKYCDCTFGVDFDAVIELGCGHACLGAWMAWKLKEIGINKSTPKKESQVPVYVTDVPSFLMPAKVTCAVNNANLIEPEGTDWYSSQKLPLRVAALTFGDCDALEELLMRVVKEYNGSQNGDTCLDGPCILLIGAGITYWECVSTPLAQTLHHFLDPQVQTKIGYRTRPSNSPAVILSHFRRDWSCEKRFFTKILSKPQLGMSTKDHVVTLEENKLEDAWHLGGEDRSGIWAPICTRDDGADWNVRVWGITQPCPISSNAQDEAHYQKSKKFDKVWAAKTKKEAEDKQKREENESTLRKKGTKKKKT